MIVVGFLAAATIGAAARWQIGERLPVPLGTILVNLSGSLALGLLAGSGEDSRTVLGIAGLGALTTFSTVMVQVIELWRIRPARAVGYAAATLAGGVVLAWLGLTLA